MSTEIQRNFSRGEVAPAIHARPEQNAYATGAQLLRNFPVARTGGVFTRPGTEYITEVKDSALRVKIREFVFSDEDNYVIEFGHHYARYIRNGIPVALSSPATAWANATLYEVGDLTSFAGVNYYAYVEHTSNTANDRPGTGTNWEDFWHPLEGLRYEIPTPYAEEDLQTLSFAQSKDVLTIAHRNYAPRDLTRFGHTLWTLTVRPFAPTQEAPSGVVVTGTAGANTYSYNVTAVSATGEESLIASGVGASLTAPTANAHTITWVAAADAVEYNVYRLVNGVPGYLGNARGTSYVNTESTTVFPDTGTTPPTARNPFAAAGDWPGLVTFHGLRIFFASTDNLPDGIWGSRLNHYYNFTESSPPQSTDAVTFRILGGRDNAINAIFDLKQLMVLTRSAEWSVRGADGGAITATSNLDAAKHSENGAGALPPILVNGTALYVERGSSIVRDLLFQFEADGYRGTDISIFSKHLFRGHTLTDWTYQQNPDSIIWAVRDDGELLSLTYLREQVIQGWVHNDTDGTFENVCCVPEADEDAVYAVVLREIDGNEVRYIERLSTSSVGTRIVAEDTENEREVPLIEEYIGLDCAISLDGRNTNPANTMTASGAAWGYQDTITITANFSAFASGDEGNGLRLEGPDGDIVRIKILNYLSATQVEGRPNMTVPASMRNVALPIWTRLVDQVSGLDHLEGKTVSILADGDVLANPNDPDYDTYTVSGGGLVFQDSEGNPQLYGVIHVGLPITCDLGTLNLENPGGESQIDKYKLVTKLTVYVEASRGGWAGAEDATSDAVGNGSGLFEFKSAFEEWDLPGELVTGPIDTDVEGIFSTAGHIFIRQSDPLPMRINAVAPQGLLMSRSRQ